MPVEAPWQHGLVERHGQVLADIAKIVVTETGATGRKELEDVVMHGAMTKNRRPGRTGYSPPIIGVWIG